MFQKSRSGFTLIELLVVIAIIGVLATLAIVSLGGARTKAKDAKKMHDITQMRTALEMYKNDAGSYPDIVTPGEPLAFNATSYIGKVSAGVDSNGNQNLSFLPYNIYTGNKSGYTLLSTLENATSEFPNKSVILTDDGSIRSAGLAMVGYFGSSPSQVSVSLDGGQSWNVKDVANTNITLSGMTVSADGSRQVVIMPGPAFLQCGIYVSNNYGSTWQRKWDLETTAKIKGSFSGKYQLISKSSGVMISNDYGETWVDNSSFPGSTNSYIAMSGDGSKMIALVQNGSGYNINISSDYGRNWTTATSASLLGATNSVNLHDVVVSGDGQKIYIVGNYNYGADKKIFISNDGGVSFVSKVTPVTFRLIAASETGSKLITASGSPDNDKIYSSVDGGVTWNTTNTPSVIWKNVDVTADGNTMLASTMSGYLYLSQDGGKSWSTKEQSRQWKGSVLSK